ncbi:MAG: hypothetical protein EA371_05360 [Gammaproteobacteria bacterium]|nr:MAG: hypothetical protein EA371_05360 [Gammaproteobacteria bacterium]
MLLLGALLTGGCEWEEGYGRINDPGPHPLVGVWQQVSMEVYLDDDDTTRALALDEALWADSGLAPAETRFAEDGLYLSVQRDLDGRELQTSSGYWIIDEDELMLFQREPVMERQAYTVSFRGELLVRMESLVDWNSDGQATDRLVTVQRRLRETETTLPVPAAPAPID